MFLLDKKNYFKGIEPVKQIKINHLFARAVLEKHVEGIVYADNIDNPKTFYVIHPYGISLLFGESGNENFNSRFLEYLLNTDRSRLKIEWMQAYPDEWHKKIYHLLSHNLFKPNNKQVNEESYKVVENTRVNFKFNCDKYLEFKNTNITEKYLLKRTDKAVYESMKGTVIPRYFWNNVDHFCAKGVGYSLIINDQAASTAYSAFIFENKLEIGIETSEEFRGKGLAMYTCSALIDYCLENNYEPIWSCRFENTASYLLAQKLGFEPVIYIPFYKVNI